MAGSCRSRIRVSMGSAPTRRRMLARDAGLPVRHDAGRRAMAYCRSIVVSLPALAHFRRLPVHCEHRIPAWMIELIKNLKHHRRRQRGLQYPGLPGPSSDASAMSALVIASRRSSSCCCCDRWRTGTYGRAISAMRDDEVAFAALGRTPKWMKMWIFALGSGIAGFAGAHLRASISASSRSSSSRS